VLELYEQWEGIGFQTDLRGIPLARAPLAKLRAEAAAQGAKTDADIQAYIQGQAKFLVDFLLGHNKRSDQGVLLDSQTFTSKDPGQTPSAVAEWAFELIKGGGSGMPEINVAIGRRVRDIARVMNAEFLLLGDTGSGSDAMHEDKTEMFAAIANSTLDDLADDTRRDIAARLVALNGLDPETCTPTMTHEPVMRAATADACRSLMMMFQAGLNPRDPAINILRNRMDLPDAPDIDETDFLLPRGAQVERLTPDGEIVPQDATLPGVAPAKPTAAAPGRAGNVNVK
jgi:hypothetical protein